MRNDWFNTHPAVARPILSMMTRRALSVHSSSSPHGPKRVQRTTLNIIIYNVQSARILQISEQTHVQKHPILPWSIGQALRPSSSKRRSLMGTQLTKWKASIVRTALIPFCFSGRCRGSGLHRNRKIVRAQEKKIKFPTQDAIIYKM